MFDTLNFLKLLIFLVTIPIVYFVYIAWFFAWHFKNTKGVAYFGKSQYERKQFKTKVVKYGSLARPFLQKIGPKISKPNFYSICYNGMYAPLESCSPESIKKAVGYKPNKNDLFVATQMKCGTTWMQQIVYEILSRGNGDLSDIGHKHLYAMSPWIESFKSVRIKDAPLIGRKGVKIIKTHLPASLCPYDEKAKYIYVTRHPVSCYKSSNDFMNAIAGPLSPKKPDALSWFCSDRMWFDSWPNHVEGYWQWAQTRSNVYFIHFEELKHDLSESIKKIAVFLDCKLTKSEVLLITYKCGFDYMKEHEEYFEMSTPTLFSQEQTFFKSGSVTRYTSVRTEERNKIAQYCKEKLTHAKYPLSKFYPDIYT